MRRIDHLRTFYWASARRLVVRTPIDNRRLQTAQSVQHHSGDAAEAPFDAEVCTPWHVLVCGAFVLKRVWPCALALVLVRTTKGHDHKTPTDTSSEVFSTRIQPTATTSRPGRGIHDRAVVSHICRYAMRYGL